MLGQRNTSLRSRQTLLRRANQLPQALVVAEKNVQLVFGAFGGGVTDDSIADNPRARS